MSGDTFYSVSNKKCLNYLVTLPTPHNLLLSPGNSKNTHTHFYAPSLCGCFIPF